jgi:hypothetical protein
MYIKTLSFLSFLLFTNSLYSNPFIIALMLNSQAKRQAACTKKLTQNRNSLLVQAEMYEKDFIKAYEHCSEMHDCDMNGEYQQARYYVVYSTIQLTEHSNRIKHDDLDTCDDCEKCETKNIKKRLVQLLESTK